MNWRRHLTARRAAPKPDVYVISYPKSGRTWLRVLLGKALCTQARKPDRLLLDTPTLSAAAGALRTDFDHDGSDLWDQSDYRSLSEDKQAYRDKRVILLARDAPDVLVSGYFEVTRRSLVFEHPPCQFDGTLAEFVRSPVFGARKVAAFYDIWSRSTTVPKQFLLIHYEDLHAGGEDVLADVLRFIGAEVNRRDIAEAVAYAGFENMRELERADAFNDPRLRPGDVADPDSYKARRGVTGGYVDYLSGSDVAYIAAEFEKRGFPFCRLAAR